MVYVPEGLSLKKGGLSGQRHNEWILEGSDAATVVRVSGYISDGVARGLQIGDLVYSFQYTTYVGQYEFTTPIVSVTLHVVVSITAGVVDLSDGLAIPVTDTD